MQISTDGLALITGFEGYRDAAYQDSVGVWTIGIGTTSINGLPVREGMTCTLPQAQGWLRDYVDQQCIPAIEAAQAARLKSHGWRTKFRQREVDALCSFLYNLGAGELEEQHTIGADIRRGATKAKIANDLLLYDEAGLHVVQGLITRRQTERAVFLGKVSY